MRISARTKLATAISACIVVSFACDSGDLADRLDREITTSGRSADPSRLVVTTYNIEGPSFIGLSERNKDQKLWAIRDAILEARSDVVLLNEVPVATQYLSYNAAEVLAAHLTLATGSLWYWAFEQTCDRQPGSFGNAVLSSAPITSSYGVALSGVPSTAECGFTPYPSSCFGTPSVDPSAYEPKGAIIAETYGIVVIGTHLTPRCCMRPVRDAQLDALKPHIDVTRHTIIAGDLNEEVEELRAGALTDLHCNILDRNLRCVDAQSVCDSPSEATCEKRYETVVCTEQFEEASKAVHDTVSDERTVKIDYIVAPASSANSIELARDANGVPISYTNGTTLASDHLAVSAVVRRTWTSASVLQTHARSGDLLFYEPTAGRVGKGRGQLYRSVRSGDLMAQRGSDNWRSTWHSIVPGDFDGDGNTNDLLFYDATNGQAEFYRVEDDGTFVLLRSAAGWRTTWDAILPLDLPSTPNTDLLFWDAEGGTQGRGLAELYTVSNSADTALLQQFNTWRSSWTHIVPGDFDGDGDVDDLFFYEADGEAYTYRVNELAGAAQLSLLSGPWHLRPNADVIEPLSFSPSMRTELLLYDANGATSGKGLGVLYSVQGNGVLSVALVRTTWRDSWSIIVSGDFEGDGRRNDLFFYDRDTGAWEFFNISQSAQMQSIGAP